MIVRAGRVSDNALVPDIGALRTAYPPPNGSDGRSGGRWSATAPIASYRYCGINRNPRRSVPRCVQHIPCSAASPGRKATFVSWVHVDISQYVAHNKCARPEFSSEETPVPTSFAQ